MAAPEHATKMLQLTPEHLELLGRCRNLLLSGFQTLPDSLPAGVTPELALALEQTALRLQDNFPYPHPFYLGQMLRPPHPVAMLAYTLAMTINPNNHAHDGGRATSTLEVEAVAKLAQMFGWTTHLGHLCSGGTVANFEALWISREVTGNKGIVASAQAHYTHERLSRVLKVPFHPVDVIPQAGMDLDHLEKLLQSEKIGTVVATLGTTGLGATDPLAEIVELKKHYGFRLHVDAAYGGYFRLASTLQPETRKAFDAITHADSIVVDPHKHGLQPYGCGCVLFRDRSLAAIYHHESPYTYFTSDDLHLGEISLECSRAGAAAAALWATMQMFPPEPQGAFARDLDNCLSAAREFSQWINLQDRFELVMMPELDIVVWIVRAETSSRSGHLAKEFFDAAAARNVHLALLSLPRAMLSSLSGIKRWDTEHVTCLRVCLMKPEHLEWMPRIISELEQIPRPA